MIHSRTEFHVPSSDGALGISIKHKAEENIRMIAMSLLHFQQQ
jgi:hypothetical protein